MLDFASVEILDWVTYLLSSKCTKDEHDMIVFGQKKNGIQTWQFAKILKDEEPTSTCLIPRWDIECLSILMEPNHPKLDLYLWGFCIRLRHLPKYKRIAKLNPLFQKHPSSSCWIVCFSRKNITVRIPHFRSMSPTQKPQNRTTKSTCGNTIPP